MTARLAHRIVSNTQTTLRSLSLNLLSPSYVKTSKFGQQYFRSQPHSVMSTDVESTTPPITYHLNSTGQNPSFHPSASVERIPVSRSLKELLPLLVAQPSHYIIIHIHGKPYLVTPGDTVRLPFRMKGVVPGDIIRLNRAACIGSRDFTLKGAPYINERIFECRATIMGAESEPMRFKEKTKRRNRKVKTVKSKHRFTILRIAELKIKTLEEIESQNHNLPVVKSA